MYTATSLSLSDFISWKTLNSGYNNKIEKKLALLTERSFVGKKEICGTFCFETIIVKGFFSSLPFQFFLELLF